MYKCTFNVQCTLGVVVMGEERIVAEIPAELKELVDTDKRTNKEIVEAALWREFGGQRKSALQRRIDEKERRISILESERNEREREIEEERQELEALQSKLETTEQEESGQLQSVLQRAEYIPADPEHPFVQDNADELGIEPTDLADAIAEKYGKERTDSDDDTDLNSL